MKTDDIMGGVRVGKGEDLFGTRFEPIVKALTGTRNPAEFAYNMFKNDSVTSKGAAEFVPLMYIAAYNAKESLLILMGLTVKANRGTLSETFSIEEVESFEGSSKTAATYAIEIMHKAATICKDEGFKERMMQDLDVYFQSLDRKLMCFTVARLVSVLMMKCIEDLV